VLSIGTIGLTQCGNIKLLVGELYSEANKI